MRTQPKTSARDISSPPYEIRDNYFEVRFPFDRRRDVVWREVCRYLQRKYIWASGRVLDLGAAYCNFINNIEAEEKHALDVSRIIEEYAEPDVTTHVRSCTDLGCFESDSFDLVFASNIFEHLSLTDLSQTLVEVLRVLKANGQLIVLQPNFKYCYRTYFDDYTHTHAYTHASLSDLMQVCGFSVVDIKPRFLPVNMKSTLRLSIPRLDLVVRAYLRLPKKPLAAQMLVVMCKRER